MLVNTKKRTTEHKEYPMFICPHCGLKVELKFNIKSRYSRSKWDEFVCSRCGKGNMED